MSGADVFTMAPEQVHEAAEALFDVEAVVDEASETLKAECDNAIEAMNTAQCAIGAALSTAVDFWKAKARRSYRWATPTPRTTSTSTYRAPAVTSEEQATTTGV